MQTAVTIILAILLPGALIVGLIVWRERRKAAAKEAQARKTDQQPTGGGGPRPVEPR